VWVANSLSERDLARLITDLGEERRARRIARAIVRARPFTSTPQLVQMLAKVLELLDSVTRALEASISPNSKAGGARNSDTTA
jgi:16S rRNA C1402 N4-methylase RsmH